MFQPVIKWSGSKRSVAKRLQQLIPDHSRYFEPFVGGGALLPYVRPRDGLLSDAVHELIALWWMVRDCPDALADSYEAHWKNLQRAGHTYYYEVRESFNQSRDPAALLFLSRTCVNGLIRFNAKGDFNNSLHHTRPGVTPARLRHIIREWSTFVSGCELQACDYTQALALPTQGDFVFLDPPYVGTRGRYVPRAFDYSEFVSVLEALTSRGVKWMLTMDGTAGTRDYHRDLPRVPAVQGFRVRTGHSPFTRLMNTSLDVISESVFFNYEPPVELAS